MSVCGYSDEPGRVCTLAAGHKVKHARSIVCRCGRIVYPAQTADGRRILVGHDGTTNCAKAA